VQIRKAKVEDSASLARVQVDSYRTAYAGIFPQPYLDRFTYEEQEQDWRDLLTSETGDKLLVAETETGEIVGYALGRPGATTVPPYDAELVAVHVRAAHQGQGIGRELVAAMARQFIEAGCRSLLAWVLEKNPARLFYEQMGGALLAETQTSQGAVEVAYGWSSLDSLCA
jgi:GNAT superfamily N-acetyltransferase